ncbi:ATP-binding protein [Kocuria rhizophila]|uniref:AAA family ATPase n=2 Tax=Kocuria rhizophila TaxID=72000 RepID=A0AAX2SD99_KOCRH|nr:RNA-binding domain-containing protein [Kocuria rhizophila]WIW67813.1 ATP-binding protein [Kocuria sp. ChxB]MBO4144080.1 putative DNA binding domain-containing protein [Kocuria rhizophila]MDA4829528.1 putative DNA binding domain-containing protein [Kocuria rhizophila]MDN3227267.1 ATP-binding protein [Kocuria rhizophila]QTK31285.1 putative DNA binding domain-containing protein [Kocuria rhizophila]
MRARRGDTTSVEVKRASGGLPHLADTICAFANMPGGGSIILGVDESSGSFDVTGLDDVAAAESGLVATARQSVSPSPHITTETHTLDGRVVLVAHVAPLRIVDKPATTGGRAYLRQSDGDYTMQEHELRMLEVAKLHADEQVDYDLQPARGRSIDDLLPEAVSAYLHTTRERDQRLRSLDDDKILRTTSVVTADGVPTLAGLYALGMYPQGHYPGLTVTAAVQLPESGGNVRNQNLEDFTGPLPVLLEDLLAWVRRNLGTVQRYREDGHMESVAEIPLNAVRELIGNALVHRDLGPNTLGVGKSIQVRLTPRNLFVLSPGGLRGVSLAQLESEDHAQAAVNQRVYQMAKKLTTSDGASIIEGEGGGLREVYDAARRHGLPRPQLHDTGVQFKALLWRPTSQTPHSGTPPAASAAQRSKATPQTSAPTVHEAKVLEVLRLHSPLRLEDLAVQTGLTTSQLRYALRLPLAEGLVAMQGGQGRKGTRYVMNNDA